MYKILGVIVLVLIAAGGAYLVWGQGAQIQGTGEYMTVDECAQHANTSQLCKQKMTPAGLRWEVTANNNEPSGI
jgi:uncharacterized protein YgiB involved in biofilm formation